MNSFFQYSFILHFSTCAKHFKNVFHKDFFYELFFLSRTIRTLFPMSSTLRTPHGTMCACMIPQWPNHKWVVTLIIFLLIFCLFFLNPSLFFSLPICPLCLFRSTAQSRSVVQDVHSPPSFSLPTRVTSVMCTVRTLKTAFSLTVLIALTMGTKRLWRHTSDCFICPTMLCARML